MSNRCHISLCCFAALVVDRISILFRQAVSYSREQVVEMMEFLIEYGPLRLYWEPAEVFHKLSCVQLLLQLISIACDWRTYYGRYSTSHSDHIPFPVLHIVKTSSHFHTVNDL